MVLSLIIYIDKKMNKHIVFDLDETIGYFKQFILILNIMESYQTIDYNVYFKLFEEYFRPHIFKMFDYILKKKQSHHLRYMVLYSNNKNDFFVNKVIEYIHHRLNTSLFDYIITYNSKRTHKHKSYSDLIQNVPTIRPEDTLCFIDDKPYLEMGPYVTYIHCEKYIFQFSNEVIVKRLSTLGVETLVLDQVLVSLKKHNILKKELPKSLYDRSSQKMLYSIEVFIYDRPLI